MGATFLRSNLGKRSVGIDLRSPMPAASSCSASRRSSTCSRRTSRPGPSIASDSATTSSRRSTRVVCTCRSRDSVPTRSEYGDWPAYASIVEAMSGIYDFMRRPDERPRPNPVGALGDISTALFAVIGVLAALRHRDTTGLGQRIDMAMYDATVAMTDIVPNFYSLGWERQPSPVPYLITSFKAKDGWFVMQMVREHQFARARRSARPAGVEVRSAFRGTDRLGRATSRRDCARRSNRGQRR